MDSKKLRVSLKGLEEQPEDLKARLKPFFGNRSTHTTACLYLQGLLSRVERKNSWQTAEQTGLQAPYGLQHLLDRALWSCDEVRDLHNAYVREELGHQEGVFIIDETGFIKKGKHSAGVARQYSGIAGRIENCQTGVFLAWANAQDSTFIDHELYLPKDMV